MATKFEIDAFIKNWPHGTLVSDRIYPGAKIPAYIVQCATIGTTTPPVNTSVMTYTTNMYIKRSDGKTGKYIEVSLAQDGYPLSKGKGADLAGFIEIKTYRHESKSDITIGCMSRTDIEHLSWTNSNIYNKMKSWLLICWSAKLGIIKNIDQLNFNISLLQPILSESYEGIRTTLKANNFIYTNKITCGVLIVEYTKNNIFKFRVKRSALKYLIDTALTANLSTILM